MDLGHPPVVAANESIEDLGEEPPLLAAEPPHDAEIDRDDAPFSVDEEIALVHVGVEKAVAQRVAQERLDQRAGELGRVEAECGEARGIAERRPVDPFHRQRGAGRAVPIDLRRAKPRIVGEVFGELGSRRRFEAEVHLDLDAARQRLDHFDQAQSTQPRLEPLGAARGVEHVGKIARESPLDAGPDELDRDVAFAVRVADLRLMHLGDRRRGDRFAKFDEQRIDRRAERGFQRGDSSGAVDRRHAVLELLQFDRDPRSNDVGPRGEELAELDVGRAEPVDRRRQAAETLRAAPRQEIGEKQRQAGERRQRRGIEIDEGAFAGEDVAGPSQPENVSKVGQAGQI